MSGDEGFARLFLDTVDELGQLIGDHTIPDKVFKVSEILEQLEEEAPPRSESLNQLEKRLKDLDGTLINLRVHFKHIIFDLEATRRERERALRDNQVLWEELKKR